MSSITVKYPCEMLEAFKSIYDLWVWNDEKVLGEEIVWSSHCPFMLEKHLFLPFSLSHPGNEDSCYGKHTMELALWMQTQLTLWQLCVFTKKIAIFKKTIQIDRERGGRGRENHVKRAHSNFNQRGRPWGWWTKWRKKPCFIVEEACWFEVTMTRPEKTWESTFKKCIHASDVL